MLGHRIFAPPILEIMKITPSGFAVAARFRHVAPALLYRVLAACLFALGCLAGAAQAQAPAPLPQPNLDLRLNGSVRAIVRQPDGGVIVGGEFGFINGVPRRNLARLHPDGSLDMDWNPAITAHQVRALAVDAEGSVYVGGYFSVIAGQPRRYLVKVSGSGTGSVDPDWNPAPNNDVNALAWGSGGNLHVGGAFTQMGGLSRNRIARVSGSGTGAVDANWNPSASGNVLALAMAADGSLYAGGVFTQIGGQGRNRIAKLSGVGAGNADPNWNPSASGIVEALAVGTDGAVYAAGRFIEIGGQARNYIAKLTGNGTGMADAQWNPSASWYVDALALDGEGAVYAGGWFSTIGGQPRNRIAKLSGTGAGNADPGWNPSANNNVNALAVAADGMVHAGGFFSQIGGQARIGLSLLSADGSAAAAIADTERTGWANALAHQPDGGIIVGGAFHRANGAARNSLLRLFPDGGLVPDWAPSVSGEVYALATDSSGAVFVGGDFSTVNGQGRSDLAKLSGSGTGELDPVWNPSPVGDFVHRLLPDNNGAVYVLGSFIEIGGQQRSYIAKLSSSGTGAADPVWNPSPDLSVSVIAQDASGAIYVCGNFGEIGGQVRNHIAKLSPGGTGAADPNWNPSPDESVYGLAVANGSVYVGGAFSHIGGQARQSVARLSASGSGAADPAWNPSADYSVELFAVDEEGSVYVGGHFTQIGGQARNHIAKLSGSGAGEVNPDWNPSADYPLEYWGNLSIANDALYMIGEFTQIGGQPRGGLAALPAVTQAALDRIFRSGFE